MIYWSYANATARTGASGFTPTDLGKFAWQIDDDSVWMLIEITPTWVHVATHNILSSEIFIPVIGSPANNTLEELNTLTLSAGVLDPTITYITQQDATHINVAAGKGLIRISDSPLAQLVSTEWAASNNILIPAGSGGVDTVRFVGIEYNAGSPQVTVRTTFNWNWYSDFPLGRVSHDGTTLRIINTYAHAEDTSNLARRFNRLTNPFKREEPPEGSGGLIVGSVLSGGNEQYISMTAGNVWHGFNRFVLDAINTSTVDTFDSHYRDGSGGFTHVLAQTQWNNTQYDDGDGGLATLTNNRYGNHWVYVDVSDGSLDLVFGRGNYIQLADALAEEIPSDIPGHLQYHGRLIGRIVFQKSDTAPTAVQSIFTSQFSSSPVTSGGHAIQDEGTPLTQRSSINFIGASVAATDDSGNDATKITLSTRLNKTAVSLASGNHNDIDYTGYEQVLITVTSDGAALFTGFVAQPAGTILVITKRADDLRSIGVAHENAGSAAANRINTPNGQNGYVYDRGSIVLVYNADDSRWNVLAIRRIDDLDVFFSDITDGNVNISNHGYAPKAVNPVSGSLAVHSILPSVNLTGWTDIFNTTNPAALGTASPGTAIQASRSDHIHTLPKLDDTAAPDDNTDLNASTSAHGLESKAVAPAAGTINFLGIENGETVRTDKAASSAPGTTAKILQSSSSGGLVLGSNSLVVDAVNNWVGVGMVPDSPITIKGLTAGGFDFKLYAWAHSANFIFFRSNGSPGSETNVLSGQTLAVFGAGGYKATALSGTIARVVFWASENFTDTATGTKVSIRTCPIGSTTDSDRFWFLETGNMKIAGAAVRATTEGTNHLDIFDGTAPVGTLTNGISIYSSGGECYIMDAAGNGSLQSPHDRETGEWIFYSKNTITGRVLRVDMERLVKAINRKFGWDFVKDYIDD